MLDFFELVQNAVKNVKWIGYGQTILDWKGFGFQTFINCQIISVEPYHMHTYFDTTLYLDSFSYSYGF